LAAAEAADAQSSANVQAKFNADPDLCVH